MGGMELEEDKAAAAAVLTNARWNPSKEQIGMLESLYKQGIRTPTADQIQDIAGKLREHGSIEGKNVFYWFQNHKARQRQKQKQETMACFNRLLHKASKVAPSPSPCPSSMYLPQHQHRHHQTLVPPPPPIRCTANAVLCSPYFFPHPPPGIGYYPHYPPVILSGTVPPNLSNDAEQFQRSYFSPHCSYKPNNQSAVGTHETLQLFPLHPTRLSTSEVTFPTNSVNSTSATTISSQSREEESGDDDNDDDGDHLVLNLECR